MKRTAYLYLSLCLTMLWLIVGSGCASNETVATDPASAPVIEERPADTEPIPDSTPADGYLPPPSPPPVDIDPSYVAPATDERSAPADAAPFIVPEPDENSGVVTGWLVSESVDGEPYITSLYLGTTIYPTGEVDSLPMISFSEDSSPLAVQDPDTGQFYFADIPPGEYTLIVWTPVFSMVLRDHETEYDIIFDVHANEVTDLGVIPVQ